VSHKDCNSTAQAVAQRAEYESHQYHFYSGL
jgi:hypothetical protein